MEAAMISMSNTDRQQRTANSSGESGFTLIEVLISTFVITIGLIALLGAFAAAMASTQNARSDMIAKQLAQEGMESIVTARETANSTWAQINNVGAGGGIFVAGFTPIYRPGADGIIGTADDAAAGIETYQDPGPDGIVGTPDDPAPVQLTAFQRNIAFTATATGNLRNIIITVRYNTPQGTTRDYVLTGMISQYR